MATIAELKEHLENGGKIRRPSWGRGNYIFIDDDELTEKGGAYFSNRALLFDDWEVYGEIKRSFKVTHTGLYKTRDGRKVFVSVVTNETCIGIVEAEAGSKTWSIRGDRNVYVGEKRPEDIVAEWED